MIGTTIGPYRITDKLGEGGMGEVYKAVDTRLDRTVALKYVKAEYTERFEREARAISALNHPHIATLHDVGPGYLVMEYVEGKPLAGPLPLEKTIEYAGQILDALEAAHRKGIVHRDLKPANILVTKGGIKLLDFGLARTVPSQAQAAAADQTMTVALTGEHTILGTPHYMAPEQIEGREADHRADLFSFGCVLYEMLTGQRAFEGKSAASIMAAVLTSEPRPVRELLPVAPERLDRVLRTCLAKDPEERWQSAADLKRELEWLSLPETTSKPRRRFAWLPWAVSGIAVLVALATGLWLRGKSTEPARAVVFHLAAPDGVQIASRAGGLAISPDGRSIAFTSVSGESTLFIKRLDELAYRTLATSRDQITGLFWSPDGASVGFYTEGQIRVADLSSGATRSLSKIESANFRGATWGASGDIVYAPVNVGSLFTMRPGSEPRPALDSKANPGGNSQTWPWFLPNGKDFLFTSALGEEVGLFVGTLGTTAVKRLGSIIGSAQYAGGYVFYLQGRTLSARAFDTNKLEFTGPELIVAENVPRQIRYGMFAVSGDTLMFGTRTGESVYSSGMVWANTEGKRELLWSGGASGNHVEVSPDGKRIVFSRERDLWIREMTSGHEFRLTFDSGNEWVPEWSPDGLSVIWTGKKQGQPWQLFRKRADGSGTEEQLTTDDAVKHHLTITADGQGAVYECGDQGGFDLCLASFREKTVRPLLNSRDLEAQPQLSPDGRWLAYMSNMGGRTEVYVRAFPSLEGPWEVSHRGGAAPRWTRDGKTLFYVNGMSQIVSVEVLTANGVFRSGGQKTLLNTVLDPYLVNSHFTVSADGKRFLVPAQEAATQFRVVVNWREWLKR